MKKYFLLFFLLSCCFLKIKAQDKIYRNNGKIAEAKILEIGTSEIKYKETANPDGPVYILETDRVKKIVFADGRTQTFNNNLKDPETYAGQSRRAVKINFFSPLYGFTEFGYEKSLSVGKSIEFSVGLIGLGKSEVLTFHDYSVQQDIKRNQAGAFVSVGYKFGKLPDFLIFGKTRMSHLMQGTYFKPVIYVGHYSENIIITKTNNISEKGKQKVTFGALQLELGKQRVFGEKMILDIYGGLGYGVDNKKSSYQYENYNNFYNDNSAFNYANARAGNSPSISLSFGIKLGLLIK
ncbi:MAG: hypothetical protein WKF88_03255 [Ferruginibacter sp.]